MFLISDILQSHMFLKTILNTTNCFWQQKFQKLLHLAPSAIDLWELRTTLHKNMYLKSCIWKYTVWYIQFNTYKMSFTECVLNAHSCSLNGTQAMFLKYYLRTNEVNTQTHQDYYLISHDSASHLSGTNSM